MGKVLLTTDIAMFALVEANHFTHLIETVFCTGNRSSFNLKMVAVSLRA